MNPSFRKFRKFWQGRRVLVTGHTGFKGAWLSLWLGRMGAEVTGFALPPPTDPSLFELARVSEGMTSIQGDVRDLSLLKEVIEEARPDLLFHLAAQSLVLESYENPVETFATNLMGTVHLLEAARCSTSVKAIVVVTSDKCYENRGQNRALREDDPFGGHDPYSSSKACAELATDAYRRSFFNSTGRARSRDVAIATVRAGNVIGGGDWAPNRLVPDMIKAFLEGRAVKIRNPEAVRPWQHVLEPLAGYIQLAERLWIEGDAFAGGWNFGPHAGDARPVSWVADYLSGRWDGSIHWLHDASIHPPETRFLSLDASKAGERLGWRPRLSLEQALDWVVEWSRIYADHGNVRDETLSQIDRYMGLSCPD